MDYLLQPTIRTLCTEEEESSTTTTSDTVIESGITCITMCIKCIIMCILSTTDDRSI